MSPSPKPKAAPRSVAPEDAPAPTTEPREIAIEDLLGAADRIFIRHGAERYMLQITRQNRLLLTK